MINSKEIPTTYNNTPLPDFKFEINLANTNCSIGKFLVGSFIVHESSVAIKSIELQFVRSETVNTPSYSISNEISEIQNLQIGDGEVLKGLEIPTYMVFPRLFSSASVRNKVVKLSFELVFIVIFENALVVSCPVPINTYRE